MGKINVLGFDVANLIAAGEVVDRPSSVVKELLENSIDAGSTAVTVEIQRGGVAFIRISDNGCGMEPEDLPVAILRHATSKIREADDLTHICSLGFRGEALAAISSVSRIRIFSKPHGALTGAILTAEGGDVVDISETGCAEGTTVVVEDLFFNVPARRSFLKKDNTEAAAVAAVVERIALSRPDISIKYICDGQLKFVTSGNGKLKDAVFAVFGKETASRALEVSRSADGISVTGYVSEPDFIKSTRNMETFFVNGRYVKSKTAMAALEQAYKTRIPQDKFPFCVLNIDVSPAAVDVNVHPAKLEVKFTNERIIFDAVYYAVLNALTSSVVRPELELPKTPEPVYRPPQAPASPKKPEAPAAPKRDSSFWIDGEEAKKLLGAFVPMDKRPEKPVQTRIPYVEREAPKTEEKHASPAPVTADRKPAPAPAPTEEVPEYVILGEAYNTYVIVQLEDRLLFVDKHAAHERIIFDELCRRMKAAGHSGQMLISPVPVELLEIEADAVSSHGDSIRSMGFAFEIKKSGAQNTALISEVPEMLTTDEAIELFRTLAEKLCEVGAGADAAAEEFFEAKLFQSACKAAVKGGRIYDTAHLKWICDRLFVVPKDGGSVIRTCPHGRPVAFEIKKSSIDRQFARLT